MGGRDYRVITCSQEQERALAWVPQELLPELLLEPVRLALPPERALERVQLALQLASVLQQQVPVLQASPQGPSEPQPSFPREPEPRHRKPQTLKQRQSRPKVR